MPMMMATIVPVDMARNVLVVIVDSHIMIHARAIAGLADVLAARISTIYFFCFLNFASLSGPSIFS